MSELRLIASETMHWPVRQAYDSIFLDINSNGRAN